MVELVIVAVFVLLPLFLAMPFLGKYLDVRTAAVGAARYAAWERTVWYGGDAASSVGFDVTTPDIGFIPGKTFTFGGNRWKANAKANDEIRKEVAVRLLSNNSNAFKSDDKEALDFIDGSRDLWRTRDGSRMLASYDDVTDTIENRDAPGLLNTVIKPVAEVTALLSPFTLETGAKYETAVTIKLQRHDLELFLDTAQASSPLEFTEANVLLANGWNAGGRDGSKYTSVMDQVRGLTPTSVFDEGLPLIDISLNEIKDWTIGLVFPEIRTLRLGKIEPDIVPADRLKKK